MKKMGKYGGKKSLYFSAGRGSGNRGPGRGPRFVVALGTQGLNSLGELDCWLYLVVGGSRTVGLIEPRVGCQW